MLCTITRPRTRSSCYSLDHIGVSPEQITPERAPAGESGWNNLLATVGCSGSGLTSSVAQGPSGASSISASYDSVGRLTSLGHDLASTTYDDSLGFSYNPASQIKQNTRSNDAYAWSGHYNVNRSYTSNGLNQYTASGSATLSYDANGNLASDGSTSYVYDDENRLVSAAGGHSASLAYDPLGRLWQVSSTSGGTTQFVYDGDRLTIEYNGSGPTMLRRYAWEEEATAPAAWYELAGVGGSLMRRALLKDERGSVISFADESGNALGVLTYDEYGIPGSGNLGRFGYTGQAWIAELGMWYYKARMYSPTLGRFLQTDPIGYADGMNGYGYAKSDPVNRVDPSGLDDDTIVITAPSVVVNGETRCFDFENHDKKTNTCEDSGRELVPRTYAPGGYTGAGGASPGPGQPPKPKPKDDPQCTALRQAAKEAALPWAS